MSKICPSLDDLPPPPKEKMGWPWTEESPRVEEYMANGSDWPLISIVTPSYNQAVYLEETIRSILLQGYPNLEYMIFDGGSNDKSIEIIKKYEPWLDYWISESDRGQSHAINKGWKKSTGDILAWLNSDDVYQRGIFSKVAEVSSKTAVGITYGDCDIINTKSEYVGTYKAPMPSLRFFRRLWSCWKGEYNISQPATFFDRKLLERTGYLKEYYHYAMDYDLILRSSVKGNFNFINETLAKFRRYPENKSSQPGLCGIDMYRMLLLDHRKTVKQLWGTKHLIIARQCLADTLFTRILYDHSKSLSDKMEIIIEGLCIDSFSVFRRSFWRASVFLLLGDSLFRQITKNYNF